MILARLGARRNVFLTELVCVGCLAAVSVTPASARTAVQNQRAARSDAAKLLKLVELPSGVLSSGSEPPGDGGALAQAPSQPALPDLAAQTMWWTVNEPWKRVVAFIDDHPPAGGELQEMGSSGGGGDSQQSAWAGFAFPAVLHVLGQRELQVLAAPLSGGGTGIRADAQVQWLIPRPAGERVPGGARVLRVSRGVPGQAPAVSVLVRKAGLVHRIARMIDGLDIVQPGAVSCPSQSPGAPIVTFVFRARRGGPVLARAAELASARPPANACQPMSFSIRGRWQPPLLDGGSVISQSQSLLGIRLGG